VYGCMGVWVCGCGCGCWCGCGCGCGVGVGCSVFGVGSYLVLPLSTILSSRNKMYSHLTTLQNEGKLERKDGRCCKVRK
jgi:hypothetical protein